MTASALNRLPASELLELLRTKACSAREVVQSCLARIEQLEPTVRAFVELDPDRALQRASELDSRSISGPLHGIPVAVKETIDVAGLKCTLGSPIHGSRKPAADADVVRRLREAGAVIMGTTVSTEYAIARAGPTTNPHDVSRTPGGSSSGSAAAVAAGMVPIAIGTQTIGSIVRPAVYCGIFGLKPTKQAISTTGVMPLSSYLDHVGPLARTAADILLAFQAMFDRGSERWPSSTPLATPKRVLRIEGPLQKHTESSSREALDRAHVLLEANGIRVDTANLSSRFEDVVACYEIILFHDIASNHGGDRDRHGAAMSDRLREIIDSGRRISERAYADAIADAQSYREEIRKLLDENSIILAPATKGTAPVFSEETGPSKLQGPWSLVGFPVLAAPCGTVDGLPVGVQLIARPQREDFLTAAGALFKAEWPGGRGDAQISGGPTPAQSTLQS